MVHPNEKSASGVSTYLIPDVGEDYSVGEHFTIGEFQCHDGTPVVLLHDALIEHLDRMRRHFDAPVHVSSGFRTGAHNERIGGVDDSVHLWGGAADIKIDGVQPSTVATYAEKEGFGGVGRYSTFTHVDVHGSGRRWDER